MIKAINPPQRQRQPALSRPARPMKFKKADVIRAVEAARASGINVVEVEIKLDGSAIRISSPKERSLADDDLFARWEPHL